MTIAREIELLCKQQIYLIITMQFIINVDINNKLGGCSNHNHCISDVTVKKDSFYV